MDRKIATFSIIATVALIVAAIALGVAFIVLSESHPSTSTPTPTSTQPTLTTTGTPQTTPTPTATPNLSSATRDSNQNIAVNYAFIAGSFGPEFGPNSFEGILNITNISKSNVIINAITYVANNYTGSTYMSTGTYYGSGYPYYGNGFQILLPNTTETFNWISPLNLNSVTIYYQASGKLFYHIINIP